MNYLTVSNLFIIEGTDLEAQNAGINICPEATNVVGSDLGTQCTRISKSSQGTSVLFLDQLDIDVGGSIVVMIGRMWDVSALTGHYLSTDFVVSDSKGNIIHCTAKGTVAHNFLHLKEGGIYSIKNFVVHPNKNNFRIVKHGTFMLEFDGSNTIRKTNVTDVGFLRYPFQLVAFDRIEPTNNKYMIDVIGYVTNIGRTTYQKGQALRVTLWGGLGDILIEKKTKHSGVHAVVLVSMTAKHYNNKLYLSSTSSTTIYDDESIPCLQELKTNGSVIEPSRTVVPVEFTQPKEGTLENTATFHCTVMIENVRTKKGWNYPSCGSGQCKKGATRQLGKWFCEACNKEIEYPIIRYRLELGVADDTAHVVIVLFDETARELVKCSAESLLASVDEFTDEDSNLPPAITNLIGTTHVLELKSHTYYEFGTFESFTCWKINPSPTIKEGASSSIADDNHEIPSTTFNSLPHVASFSTLSKGPEEKKKKRTELKDSDADEDCGSSKKSTIHNGDAHKDKKKKKSGFGYSDEFGSK